MGIAPAGIGTTYAERLRQYQRRESMVLWVGAGLAGLIGLLASNLTDGAPRALEAVTASLILIGVAALATARIKFEWAATQLDREIQDGKDPSAPLPADHQKWPEVGEIAWLGGLLSVPVAGAVYLAAVWCAAT